MKNFMKAMDELPNFLKVILCMPVLDIIWAVYRIMKGVVNKSLIQLIVGILWIVPGAVFLWIVDIICVISNGKISFDEL